MFEEIFGKFKKYFHEDFEEILFTIFRVVMEYYRFRIHISFEKLMFQIGHTFSFGTYYSDRLGSCYVDINCQRTPLHMCSYGIGVSRLLSATVELLSSEDELRWPFPIAPYSICIIPPKVWNRKKKISRYKTGNKNMFHVPLS